MRVAMLWLSAAALWLSACQCDDSLQGALEAITRRQRDLADSTLYYIDHFRPISPHQAPAVVVLPREEGDGQPESIGYGYQKSLSPKTAGIFEAIPLADSELGSHDPGTESHVSGNGKEIEDSILDYIEEHMGHHNNKQQRVHNIDQNLDSKRSVFRERDVNVPPELLQDLYPEDQHIEQYFENGEHPKLIIPSPFRERVSSKPSKNHHTQNAQSLVRSFGGLNRDEENFPENGDDSDEYLSMLNSVWENYQAVNPEHLNPEDLSESDVEEILDYINRKPKRQHDNRYKTGNDFFNSPLAWVKRSNQRISDVSNQPKDQFLHALKFLNGHTDTLESMRQEDVPDEERDIDVAKILLNGDIALKNQHRQVKRFWRGNVYKEPLSAVKRYPVTKRSPSFYTSPTLLYHKQSFSNNLNQRTKKNIQNNLLNDVTDPGVAQEINDIFSPSVNTSKIQNTSKNISLNTTNIVDSVRDFKNSFDKNSAEVTPNKVHITHTKRSGQKEVTGIDNQHKRKKSVQWSDYFGIDKRTKKSVHQTGSDDWLLDQYLKAYSISNKESNENNNIQSDRSDFEFDKKNTDDMDAKLSAMEDMIVDQALKYTGAHEGIRDSDEIQAVKDKVITQLAAAYSLEKMRKALSEFKSSMVSQLGSTDHTSTNAPDVPEHKDKRVSIKKEKAETTLKGVRFEKKEDVDNNIHAFHHGGHFHSSTWNPEESCPVMDDISERCKEIGIMAGDTSEALHSLCNLHQVCYLCGSKMGITARGCDVTFMSQANHLCGERARCWYIVHRTVTAMRSMHGDPSPRGQSCDFQRHPCLTRYLAVDTRR